MSSKQKPAEKQAEPTADKPTGGYARAKAKKKHMMTLGVSEKDWSRLKRAAERKRIFVSQYIIIAAMKAVEEDENAADG